MLPRITHKIATGASVVLLALLCISDPASSHLGSPPNSWYFGGLSLKTNGQPSDPINFVFMPGSADATEYKRKRIEEHVDDDWNTSAVGGRPWLTDDEIDFYCKEDQSLSWGTTSDKTDWHGTTSRSPGFCGNQHHARFWDDAEHSREWPSHGAQHQWVVGGVHHERVYRKKVILAGHKIDRDWNVVRREFVKALGRHCSNAAWAYHEGAVLDKEAGQGFENWGFIARISLQHKASGCSGHLG